MSGQVFNQATSKRSLTDLNCRWRKVHISYFGCFAQKISQTEVSLSTCTHFKNNAEKKTDTTYLHWNAREYRWGTYRPHLSNVHYIYRIKFFLMLKAQSTENCRRRTKENCHSMATGIFCLDWILEDSKQCFINVWIDIVFILLKMSYQ